MDRSPLYPNALLFTEGMDVAQIRWDLTTLTKSPIFRMICPYNVKELVSVLSSSIMRPSRNGGHEHNWCREMMLGKAIGLPPLNAAAGGEPRAGV